MKTDLLFVYGSLRTGMPKACLPEGGAAARAALADMADVVGPARLTGVLVDLGDYPAFVDTKGGEVIGDVFRSASMPTLLEVIDAYEESVAARARRASDREYYRTRKKVTLDDGERVYAWVYALNAAPPTHAIIADGDYLGFVRSRAGGGS